MSHWIHTEIDRLEGTLIRILGLVERRGFHLDEIVMRPLGEDKRVLSLNVRPLDASRSLETLGLQIDRLYGITRLLEAPDLGHKAPQKELSA